MDNIQMMKELLAGKKVRNKGWGAGTYLQLIKGTIAIYNRECLSSNFLITIADYSQWEIVKEEPVKEGMKFSRDGEIFVVVTTGETTSRLVSMKTWKSISYVNVHGMDVDKVCKANGMEKLA